MKRLLVLVFALLPVLASAQPVGPLPTSPAPLFGLPAQQGSSSNPFTNVVFTGQTLGPTTTCAAPDYSATGFTTSGMAITVAPSVLICVDGVAVVTTTASAVTIPSAVTLGWSDTAFSRVTTVLEGAGILAGRFYVGIAPENTANVRMNVSDSDASDVVARVQNTGTGNASFMADVDGAGDPTFLFEVSGATNWSLGIDNSDSDAFQIIPAGGLGAGYALRLDKTTLGATFGGPVLAPTTALAATTVAGVTLSNTTAGTGGTVNQASPALYLSGNMWTGAASATTEWKIKNLPVGAGNYSQLTFQHSLNGAADTTPWLMDSGGALQGLNAGSLIFGDRATQRSTAQGLWQVSGSTAENFGLQVNTGTAAPTVGTCGTGTIDSGSRNMVGGFTATGATACTVTFGSPAWTNIPWCVVTLENVAITTPYVSARSTTAFTVSGLTAGDKVTYWCGGRI